MSHTRNIKTLKVLKGDATHLVVEVYYQIGGMNYFQGCTMKRGIYLSATPVTRTENSRITKGFSGTTKLVLELKRFNQKAIDNFVPDSELVQRLIDSVVAKNGLELEK